MLQNPISQKFPLHKAPPKGEFYPQTSNCCSTSFQTRENPPLFFAICAPILQQIDSSSCLLMLNAIGISISCPHFTIWEIWRITHARSNVGPVQWGVSIFQFLQFIKCAKNNVGPVRWRVPIFQFVKCAKSNVGPVRWRVFIFQFLLKLAFVTRTRGWYLHSQAVVQP